MKEEYGLFLRQVNALDSGNRAALKRSAGIMLADADGKAIAAFYRCLPYGTPRRQESRWFAAACLRCLWDAGEDSGEPLEKVIGAMTDAKDEAKKLSDSTQHRIEALMDTDWDEDGYMLTKLTRLVKLIRQKSERTTIDFAALLDDLLGWNHESQYVQRKWARAIFTTNSEN